MAKPAKPMELIYSQQSTDYMKERHYANPRFFSTPRAGVTKVYIVGVPGQWPEIEDAYKALEVPIEYVDESAVRRAAGELPPIAVQIAATAGVKVEEVEKVAPTVSADDRGKVEIPENWLDLPWVAKADQISMRQIAALVSDTPVLNKAQAVVAIENELGRRNAVAKAAKSIYESE